jgi:hypothetical protein
MPILRKIMFFCITCAICAAAFAWSYNEHTLIGAKDGDVAARTQARPAPR